MRRRTTRMEPKAADRLKEQVAEVKDAYQESKQSVRDLTQAAVQTSKEAVAFTDECIRDNAWKLFGAAVAVGVVLGYLCSRRGERIRPESGAERVPH